MWGQDSKVRDLRGYEADELPDCSTPRRERVGPRKLGQRRDRVSTQWSDQTTSPVYSKWSSRDAKERTNALDSLRRNG